MIVPVFHKFVVFSIVGDDDKVISKRVTCNNCGAAHLVNEIGRSEINVKKEGTKVPISIDDIRVSLPDKIVSVLDSYNVDLPTWEEVQFIIQNGVWGRTVVLSQETDELSNLEGKILQINGPTDFSIASFSRQELIEPNA